VEDCNSHTCTERKSRVIHQFSAVEQVSGIMSLYLGPCLSHAAYLSAASVVMSCSICDLLLPSVGLTII